MRVKKITHAPKNRREKPTHKDQESIPEWTGRVSLQSTIDLILLSMSERIPNRAQRVSPRLPVPVLETNELSTADAARAEPGQLARILVVTQAVMKVPKPSHTFGAGEGMHLLHDLSALSPIVERGGARTLLFFKINKCVYTDVAFLQDTVHVHVHVHTL